MNGSLMSAEMAEQPVVLANLLARRAPIVDEVAAIVPAGLAGITLVARGSSDNAALFGRYILEIAARRPAGLAAPSIQTIAGASVDYTGYLAVAISQSGETPEIVTFLKRVRDQGARTLAIVNAPGSPLGEIADATIEVDAGSERAVPATKTFTATLLALAIAAEAAGAPPWTRDDLDAVPGAVAAVLDDPDPVERLAARLDGRDRLIVTARGPLLVAALETALKVRETCAILAEGISGADLRHGPIAAVGRGFPMLTFEPARPQTEDSAGLRALLAERGAAVHTSGPSPDTDLPLPVGVPDALLPILASVRGQQLAAAVARRRGLDADAPQGLTKVTMTR